MALTERKPFSDTLRGLHHSDKANKVSLPNFLIIGAAKAGTTSLYHYLRQHPDIFMPSVKEPNYFIGEENEELNFRDAYGKLSNSHWFSNLIAYQALFKGAEGYKAIGEASPKYLYFRGTAARIKACLGDVKIIVILRNPVDRAYSNFLHLVRDGKEPHNDFAMALNEEPQRVQSGWGSEYHYQGRSFYYEALLEYYSVFGPANVQVFLYDDLLADSLGVVRTIFGVLGVDDTLIPKTEKKYNVSGIPKNKLIHRLHYFLSGSNNSMVKNIGKVILPAALRRRIKDGVASRLVQHNLSKPPLSPAVKDELKARFRNDVLKVQELIGRDLTDWL